jgi:arsenate reductase
MRAVIYHNPRCGKSRETLSLLEQHGISPDIIEYLKTPPSVEELKSLLKKLKMKPRELMRVKEPVYKEKKLDNPKLSDEALIKAMHDNPILIERPIVVYGARAMLGRPPENVVDLFPTV